MKIDLFVSFALPPSEARTRESLTFLHSRHNGFMFFLNVTLAPTQCLQASREGPAGGYVTYNNQARESATNCDYVVIHLGTLARSSLLSLNDT